MTWWLEAGEDGSDRIDLMAGGYLVLANGFDIVEDQEYPDQYQQLFIPLSIQGTSANDLFNKRRAILTKLRQAEQGRQPAAGAPWVNIAIQFGDADTLVRWYVVSGSLTQGSLNSIPSHTLGAMEEPALLQLRVLKGGLGEAIEYGPFTVAGNDLTFHIDGIPGDEPALAEFRITDNSTNGAVVNRLRWACRSLPDMTAGQFDPVESFATSGDADSDTFSGYYETVTGSSSWQSLGNVSRAASAYDAGLHDLWLRVRDATIVVPPPGSHTATGTNGIRVVQKAPSSQSSSPAWPMATTEGNLLVLVVYVGTSTSSTISVPFGWTAGPVVAEDPSLAFFYKNNAPSESGTVQVSRTGSSVWWSALVEISGVAVTNPLVDSNSNTFTSNALSTVGTGTLDQAYNVAVMAFATESAVTITPNDIWDEVADVSGFYVAADIFNSTSTVGYQAGTAASQDWASGVMVFKGQLTTQPALVAGTYETYVVATHSTAGASAPSIRGSVTFNQPGAILAEWTAAEGDVSGYRVYVRLEGDTWGYFSVANTETSLLITTLSGRTAGDPPAETSGTASAFRVSIGPESGTTTDIVSPPLSVGIGGDVWEPLYAGRTYIGPAESPLIADANGWRVAVEGLSDTGASLDLDALVLMPADEQQMDVRYAPGDLDTARTWVVGTTPDMRSYGFLRDGSANEVGRLLAVGRALLGPGDTTCVLIPTVEGGIWNVDDVELSITVFIRPRYQWLSGGA